MTNTGMQRFIDREGELALRLLTTKASDFETRLIALVGELVREEASAGRLDPAVPLDDLPYVLVRIMESYIYLGLITGEHPDPDRAARVISALLPRGAAARPAHVTPIIHGGQVGGMSDGRAGHMVSGVAAGWRRRREPHSPVPRRAGPPPPPGRSRPCGTFARRRARSRPGWRTTCRSSAPCMESQRISPL